MYKVLLRCVVTGKKRWWDNCYFRGKMKKNKIILWQSPEDDSKQRYKMIAWQWQGYDKPLKGFDKEINDFATQALLGLDIPDSWREELTSWQNRHNTTLKVVR